MPVWGAALIWGGLPLPLSVIVIDSFRFGDRYRISELWLWACLKMISAKTFFENDLCRLSIWIWVNTSHHKSITLGKWQVWSLLEISMMWLTFQLRVDLMGMKLDISGGKSGERLWQLKWRRAALVQICGTRVKSRFDWHSKSVLLHTPPWYGILEWNVSA